MQVYKTSIRYASIIGVLCALSCGPLNIFDAEDYSPDGGEKIIENADLLYFHTGGGIAGVNQVFSVDSSGKAVLRGYVQDVLYRSLTGTELDNLVKLFTQNNFFQLEDSYFSNVVDAFIYEIRFTSYGMEKTVLADDGGAPASLQNIIEGLRDISVTLLDRGPVLLFELDRTWMMPGDTLHMKLTVSNPSSEVMTLEFQSSQLYDFYVMQQNQNTYTDEVVWNWAHDRVFLAVLTAVDLQANESRIYEEEWTGVSNDGVPLSGSLLIGAQIPGHPGGAVYNQNFEIRTPRLISCATTTYGDSLRVTISTVDTLFSCDDVIEITLLAENISPHPLHLPAAQGSTFLTIERADEQVRVWSSIRVEGEMMATLTQGGMSAYRDAWTASQATNTFGITGDYIVRGSIFAAVSAPLRIRVTL